MSAFEFIFVWAACCLLVAIFMRGAFFEDRNRAGH
jgi:hypothetical protein